MKYEMMPRLTLAEQLYCKRRSGLEGGLRLAPRRRTRNDKYFAFPDCRPFGVLHNL